MPWYKSGAVSCTQNSTTVTGTSTAFAANARVGDAFLGPDGRWYEVVNVASDTVLSILPAYVGATVAAGSYALAPMQGYVKDSADALRTLVNKFGALAASAPINALSALAGTAGKFPYFIDAQTMGLATLTDYAKSGQNSDIKSLTGLTTPLSVAQGGTGGTSQPYTRSNALGTVSQSGGVPTGSIIETGSNSNGRYTKFADGTMICTILSGPLSIAPSSIYNGPTLNFPAAFSSEVRCHLTFSGSFPYDLSGNFESGVSTTACRYSVKNSNSANTLTPYLYITAIGRWF